MYLRNTTNLLLANKKNKKIHLYAIKFENIRKKSAATYEN